MKTRGFEIVKKYENAEINLPQRMTKNAAGYDIESAENVEIAPQQIAKIPTGIKVYMRADEAMYLYNRSSLPSKKGLSLVNAVGVIDADYYGNAENEGEIFVALRNFTEENVVIEKGERVAQGVFAKILLTDDDEVFAKNERAGGFGSTK